MFQKNLLTRGPSYEAAREWQVTRKHVESVELLAHVGDANSSLGTRLNSFSSAHSSSAIAAVRSSLSPLNVGSLRMMCPDSGLDNHRQYSRGPLACRRVHNDKSVWPRGEAT